MRRSQFCKAQSLVQQEEETAVIRVASVMFGSKQPAIEV